MNSIGALAVVLMALLSCQEVDSQSDQPCSSTPASLMVVLPTVPGTRYMPYNPRPQVMLEMFMGIHDDLSRDQWEIIQEVLDYYGNDKLDVVVHQMPLPQYKHSYLATQAIFAIQNSSKSLSLFNFIEEMMEAAANFSTESTFNLSEAEVLNMTAELAVKATEIDKDSFLSSINNYRLSTEATFMYGVKRGVYCVPAFFLNGAELTGDVPPTREQWIAFLNQYISVDDDYDGDGTGHIGQLGKK